MKVTMTMMATVMMMVVDVVVSDAALTVVSSVTAQTADLLMTTAVPRGPVCGGRTVSVTVTCRHPPLLTTPP